MDESFFSKPYSDRQFIVFVDDEEQPKQQSHLVSKQLLKPSALQKTITRIPAIPVAEMVKAAAEAYSMIRSLKAESAKKNVGVLPIERNDASLFKLPPGHPGRRILYVGHPMEPRTYIPFADFHRFTFEHKFSEAWSLLMHLGARKIRLTVDNGWGMDFLSHLDVAATSSLKAGLRKSTQQKSSTSLLCEVELPGNNEPRLPENLAWFPHEPTWQSAAEGRMKFGMAKVRLNLTYRDDFGVDAQLAAKVKKVGFELGGVFQKCEATSWAIEGEFPNEGLRDRIQKALGRGRKDQS